MMQPMSPEDRKALAGIVVGVAWGALTMAGPLAFPAASQWVWQASFAVAAIIVLAGAVVLIYDFFVRPRGRRLDPFIATAIISMLVAIVSLGIFVARGPQLAGSQTEVASAVRQPELLLLPPVERHEIRWSPLESNEIQIAPEGKIVKGTWLVPSFVLKASNAVAAQDVTIQWQADMVGIEGVVKNSKEVAGTKFDFSTNQVQISGSSQAGDWRYVLLQTADYPSPFVTQAGVKAILPVNVFTNLMLYVIALMPEKVGAVLDPFTFTVTVKWNLPQPGVEKFVVTASVSNAKAPGISKPKVDALVSFAVKKI